MATTAEEVWQLLGELIEAQKENKCRFEAIERLLKEQNGKIEQIENAIRQISIDKRDNPLGEFVEWKPLPVIIHLFQERGIDIYQSSSGVKVERFGDSLNIGFFLLNDTEAILIKREIELIKDDVNEHLDNLSKFKQLMPRYQYLKGMGGVMGTIIPEEVASYADRQGLFVLAQSEENIVILNDAKFQPRVW